MKYIQIIILWLSFKKNSNAYYEQIYEGYQKDKFSGLVLGGVEVPITMYPHVAVIIIKHINLCGGAIVSDRLIVTAGHCVIDNKYKRPLEPDSFEVFLGSDHLYQGKLYHVCKVVLHELYSYRHNEEYFYDIAVLMLSNRIKFGRNVQKVAIAPNKSWKKENYYFTVAGFGKVETHGHVSKKLLVTRLHYVDSKICNQSQSGFAMIVPDHMFCMIGQRWTGDCYGDSGSGIIWRGYLVGMVSTGRDIFCGADMMPSMYTDVTYFRKWIASKIKEADSLSDESCPFNEKQQNLEKQ